MSGQSDDQINYFARTNFRNEGMLFGIRQCDRRSHMYIIGKTGTGKSTLFETLIRGDLQAGRGLALLDPHGDLVEAVMESIPDERKHDIIYFNVPDLEHPLAFNPLERVPSDKQALAASGLLDAFRKIWLESWGPRLEYILRHCLLALLEQPESKLGDILRLLTDGAFRKHVALRVSSKPVREFWLREYEAYPARFRQEAIAPLQNKVGAFVADPVLNRILGQPNSSFNLRQVMDSGKILLVNLAKGRIGTDASRLLGALLVSQISLAALSRADTPENERRDFFLYLDEFHTFATPSLTSMLSELRKFRCSLILAHQYLSQVEEPILDALLGNAGTLISFRVGAADAEELEREFEPEFYATDLVNLPNHSICLKLMIDGAVSKPFSAETITTGHVFP